MKLTKNRISVLLGGAVVAAASFATVAAQTPPGPPDYYWPYGLVQVNGANITPSVQPVLAIVNGQVCGRGETLVATAGENVPQSDVGKTVYKVDVLADGDRVDQKPGCGEQGDPVSLYFPLLRRMAQQTPSFHQGGERVDLTLGPSLENRLIVPAAAKDGQ